MYYDDNLLIALALAIKRPIKIDMNTSLAMGGRFARLCIEVDLNKPLVAQFTLDGKNFIMEYEGLHIICFTCGHFLSQYGYLSDQCSKMYGGSSHRS